MNLKNRALQQKYQFTAFFYDLLDYYWERQYRVFRSQILSNICGKVLEAGVGTGRNFCHYPPETNITGIDLCSNMLKIANKRAQKASCDIFLLQNDATQLTELPSNHYDWYVSFFMFCVMPDELQDLAIKQIARVLRPDGKFLILEMIYSKDEKILKRQKRFKAFVEKVYGARFDRQTLRRFQENEQLKVEKTFFVKADVYLMIEGIKGPAQKHEKNIRNTSKTCVRQGSCQVVSY
jgi:ubiquinone/menaquinone biosynthesis C-methylase UbiE